MAKRKTTNTLSTESVATTPVVEEATETLVVEEVKKITGTVSGCERLRIRKSPNGEELTIVTNGTKLVCEESDEDWFAVTLEDGTTGFAMKKFISIN